eukprot:TRINITY_DN10362_c0_g1_i3.p1 TRINITY_DN10362_c0_g1~~TRINITY_DN10362_c0_g1_i3.p1  ORF type:complete len:247 (-),score=22.32 TRINITY_DN10362_c0_g1_i3:287-1027(-)
MRIARHLNIVPHSQCQKKLRSVREYSFVFNNQMICAEGESVDACRGDSGGPLIYNLDGQMVLVGITSWGPRDSQCITYQNVTRPGIYTRVQFYQEWINSIANLVKVTKESVNKPPPSTTDLQQRQQVLEQSMRTLGTGNDQFLSQQSNSVFSSKSDEIGQPPSQVVLPPVSISPIQMQFTPTTPAPIIQVPYIKVNNNLIDGIQIPFDIQIIDGRSLSPIITPTESEDAFGGQIDVSNSTSGKNNT